MPEKKMYKLSLSGGNVAYAEHRQMMRYPNTFGDKHNVPVRSLGAGRKDEIH